MIIAIAVAGILVFLVAGFTWTARLLRISNLDAQALAEKTAHLRQWSINGAHVAAHRQGPELELRRRQTLERVHATLLNEDSQAW